MPQFTAEQIKREIRRREIEKEMARRGLAIPDSQSASKFATAEPESTLPVSPPSADPPYPYKESPLGIFDPMNRLRSVGNIPHDATQVALNAGEALMSPIQTGKALVKAAIGMPFEVGNRLAGLLGQKTIPLPFSEPGMLLDDTKKRYVDELSKTLTNEPVQSIMDVLGLVQPMARGIGGTKGALAAQKLNPLKQGGDIAGKILGKVTDRSKTKGTGDILRTRPTTFESMTRVGTGRPANEAQKIRRYLGERNDPEELRNFHIAQEQKSGKKLEEISNKVETWLLEKQAEASAMWQQAENKWIKESGKQGLYNLAEGLNDIKASLVPDIRRFNINVKGRAKLKEGIEASRTEQKTPTIGYRGTKNVTIEDMSSREPYLRPGIDQSVERALATGQLQNEKVPTGEYTKPPTTQGKDMSGWLKKAFKPTGQNVPNMTDAQLSTMEDIVNKVLILKNPLPTDIKAVKDWITTQVNAHGVKYPKEPINAFAAPIIKRLDDLLRKEVKGFGELSDKYGAHLNDRKRIVEAFSLGSGVKGRVDKLLNIFEDNDAKDFARDILDDFVKSTGDKEAIPTILGANWSGALGEKLMGKSEYVSAGRKAVVAGGGLLGGVAGGVVGPLAAATAAIGAFAAFTITSPKQMSKLLLAMGKRATKEQNKTLQQVGQVLTKTYNEAQMRGIPIEGLTYGEVLQRLAIPERAEEQNEKVPIDRYIMGRAGRKGVE